MTYSLYAKSPCVYTVYGRKISLRLVQLNLVSLGRKENYKEGKEIFLAIVLWLVDRKRGSSKRDFVDRCTLRCCCTLFKQSELSNEKM